MKIRHLAVLKSMAKGIYDLAEDIENEIQPTSVSVSIQCDFNVDSDVDSDFDVAKARIFQLEKLCQAKDMQITQIKMQMGHENSLDIAQSHEIIHDVQATEVKVEPLENNVVSLESTDVSPMITDFSPLIPEFSPMICESSIPKTNTNFDSAQTQYSESADYSNCVIPTIPISQSNNSLFYCYKCGEKFDVDYKLTDHLLKHSQDKQIKCKYCVFTSNDRRKLRKHVTSRHPGLSTSSIDSLRHKCELCDHTFRTPTDVRIHMRKHTGERPYQCEICEKRYFTKGTLKEHYRTHTGEKPFMCNICGKCFTQNSSLNYHKKTH